MKPFELRDARTVAQAVEWLSARAAMPIASGGDLLGLWKEGLVQPGLLVNLATVPELAAIERMPHGGWRLGAMARLAVLRRAPGLPPMLADAIDHIASPQLRETTTLGGNLLQRPRCLYFRHPDIACFKKPGGRGCPAIGGPAEAHPGALFAGRCRAGHPSDLAPLLIALDARAEIAGPHGRREIALAALYADAATRPDREAAIEPDELLVSVTLPGGDGPQAFAKIAPRSANEFSTACAAVALHAPRGRIEAARVVLGGIAPGPWACDGAQGLMVGRHGGDIDAADVAARLVPNDGGRPAAALHRAAAARLAIEQALAAALKQALTQG